MADNPVIALRVVIRSLLDDAGCISAEFSKMEVTQGAALLTLRVRLFVVKVRIGDVVDHVLGCRSGWLTGKVHVEIDAGVDRGREGGTATIVVSAPAYSDLHAVARIIAASVVAKAITK